MREGREGRQGCIEVSESLYFFVFVFIVIVIITDVVIKSSGMW